MISTVIVCRAQRRRCFGNSHRIQFLAASIWLLGTMVWLEAGDAPPPNYWNRVQAKPGWEKAWEALKFQDDKANEIVQSFAILGRYQGQYWSAHSEQGSADGWENRRMYLGAEAELFHNFTVQMQIKIREDFDPFYDGLFQAFVRWSPSDAISLTAGRLDFLYAGLERSRSSRLMPTIERGLLVNQLMPAQVVGFLAQGKAGAFSYRAGIFSGSIETEFARLAGGGGAVAGVGYALPLFFAEGQLHLDYLYNNGNPANNAFKPYDHVVSLWHQGQSGPLGLGTDLTAGHGHPGRKSVMGLTLLPTYVFANDLLRNGDALEAVLRYQYATSDGATGLLLQSRYEQKVSPLGMGDNYHAFYFGLNYLIYGNRLKLMTGAEYSLMKNPSAGGNGHHRWTGFTGIRLYF